MLKYIFKNLKTTIYNNNFQNCKAVWIGITVKEKFKLEQIFNGFHVILKICYGKRVNKTKVKIKYALKNTTVKNKIKYEIKHISARRIQIKHFDSILISKNGFQTVPLCCVRGRHLKADSNRNVDL